MRITLTFFFAAFIFIAGAQTTTDWGVPYNEEDQAIIYEEVVQVAGTNKDELFKKAVAWIEEYYTNAAKKIYEKDQAGGKIKVKDRIVTYSEDKNGKSKDAIIDYKLDIYVKDGRFKYKIYGFRSFQGSVSPPLEKWMDPTFMDSEEARRKFALLHAEMEKLIAALTKAMKEKDAEDEDDW